MSVYQPSPSAYLGGSRNEFSAAVTITPVTILPTVVTISTALKILLRFKTKYHLIWDFFRILCSHFSRNRTIPWHVKREFSRFFSRIMYVTPQRGNSTNSQQTISMTKLTLFRAYCMCLYEVYARKFKPTSCNIVISASATWRKLQFQHKMD